MKKKIQIRKVNLTDLEYFNKLNNTYSIKETELK